MTKLEFAEKLEKYQQRRGKDKWISLLLGVFMWVFAFFPETIMYIDSNMFGLTAVSFFLLGALCFFKAWSYSETTEEHRRLIDALKLLSSPKNET